MSDTPSQSAQSKMIIVLPGPKTFYLRNNVEVVLSQLVVNEIIDTPSDKTVSVNIDGFFEPVILFKLSYNNYNNPEWNDALVISAVITQVAMS